MKRKFTPTGKTDSEYKVFKNYPVEKEQKITHENQSFVVPWEIKNQPKDTML